MTCNRSRLHYQFIRNRRLLLRLNLEFFTLHHCEMKRDFGDWVSSLPLIFMVMSLCLRECHLPVYVPVR